MEMCQILISILTKKSKKTKSSWKKIIWHIKNEKIIRKSKIFCQKRTII